MGRLFAYNSNERPQFIVGLIAALANGCAFPIFSFFLSRMITILVKMNPKYVDMFLDSNASDAERSLKKT